MSNFDRYGFVQTDPDGRVISFEEKRYQHHGLIDGGIYIIKNNIFNKYIGDDKFLFTDYVKNNLKSLSIGSGSFDKLFIDIGTPEDLEEAKKLFKNHL